LVLSGAARAERDIYVEVRGFDSEQQLLKTVRVVPDGDRSRYYVNSMGKWVETQRRLDNGDSRPLEVGDVYSVFVTAPGYQGKRVETVLQSPGSPLDVELERLRNPALGCLAGHSLDDDVGPLTKWATYELERASMTYQGAAYTERVSCLRATLAVAWHKHWEQLELERVAGADDQRHHDRRRLAWTRAKTASEEWLDWNRTAGLPTGMATSWCDSTTARPCR